MLLMAAATAESLVLPAKLSCCVPVLPAICSVTAEAPITAELLRRRIGDLAERGAVGHLHDDGFGLLPGQVRRVHRDRGECAGAGVAERVTQAAVQQVLALEARGVGDAVDGVQDRVNLELISADFVGAEPAGVGRLVDQALKLGQQVADFVQAAFGGSDDVVGADWRC